MIFRTATIVMLLTAGLLAKAGPAAAGQTGTILVPDLRLRSGPGSDYRVLSGLERGDRVQVLGQEHGWLKIEHAGRQGYILQSDGYVAVSDPAESGSRADQNTLKKSQTKAETIHTQLRRAESNMENIDRKEKAVIDEFNAAEETLNRTRQQVRAAQAGLAQLKDKIGEIETRSQALETEINGEKAYADRRLTALYKLNWVGRIQLLATADSFFDFVRRRSSLKRILAQDEASLESLHNDQVALESLLTELNAEKAQKRSLELALSQRMADLNAQQDQRKAMLGKIRNEKSLEQAALASLRQAALDLDATVERIEPTVPIAAARSEAKTEDKPFEAYKGLLSWPVKGKIISFFGLQRDQKYAVTSFQSGINIQAERGEPIHCVCSGYTIFSSWLKGFGNMMIIDHGDHYYTVYAHLEEVFKVKGDRVEKNEVIATVGDSGSMMGPALHFEVRHHGKPVDPMQWVHKG
jgi:septal ring factor EnvC (AmiA/AmiB activator)